MALDPSWLRQEFAARHAGTPRLFRAPGRVNLIGEHTDYNDGYVLPVAMDRAIWFCVAPRDDRLVSLTALDFGESETFSLDRLEWTPGGHWSNYIKAMAQAFEQLGHRCVGFEGVLAGDLPIGGGVSSSSALVVAAATTLERLSGIELDELTLIRHTQLAENAATGLRGGIMDQFTSRRARAGQAVLIDCRSLASEYVSMPEVSIVVADTNKPRKLADSPYNQRRAECEEGARAMGVPALRDADLDRLNAHRDSMSEVVYRRCRHVISENARVLDCVDILRAGDLAALGRRINESHLSLRDDYEVSCAELDAIAELAWATQGVYGARMVGAGFGGCVIALSEAGAVATLQQRIADEYPKRCGLVAEVYATVAGDGAGEM